MTVSLVQVAILFLLLMWAQVYLPLLAFFTSVTFFMYNPLNPIFYPFIVSPNIVIVPYSLTPMTFRFWTTPPTE